LVPAAADGRPDPAVQQTARYLDAVNFATRARCQGAAVTVGYIDLTCPPSSVMAAYNALPVAKRLHVDVLAGHTNTPGAIRFMQEAALEHVRSQRR
jgi:cephalosporin-C deacetylase-like acetyl esterase